MKIELHLEALPRGELLACEIIDTQRCECDCGLLHHIKEERDGWEPLAVLDEDRDDDAIRETLPGVLGAEVRVGDIRPATEAEILSWDKDGSQPWVFIAGSISEEGYIPFLRPIHGDLAELARMLRGTDPAWREVGWREVTDEALP